MRGSVGAERLGKWRRRCRLESVAAEAARQVVRLKPQWSA
nr:MAG TPA: hypothetical protein [Caudoviricetes sp.]